MERQVSKVWKLITDNIDIELCAGTKGGRGEPGMEGNKGDEGQIGPRG
jgi:hypothetical protein